MQSRCIALIHGTSDTCIPNTDHCTHCTQSMIYISCEMPLGKYAAFSGTGWQLIAAGGSNDLGCQVKVRISPVWPYHVWVVLAVAAATEHAGNLVCSLTHRISSSFQLIGLNNTLALRGQHYNAKPSKSPGWIFKIILPSFEGHIIRHSFWVQSMLQQCMSQLCDSFVAWFESCLCSCNDFLGLACTPCSWHIDMCQNLCIWCMLSDLSPFYLQPATIKSVVDMKHM